MADIRVFYKNLGYPIDERPYAVNICGFRKNSKKSNAFDDVISIGFYDSKKKWNQYDYKATTDPGTFYLLNPEKFNKLGTAIVKPNFYKNAYAIGWHYDHEALTQVLAQVEIWRDYNRDSTLDFYNGTSYWGFFGTNIHWSGDYRKTTVDRWSAGCQVIEDPNDFRQFMTFCRKHRDLYGNVFSYGLIDFRHAARVRLKQLAQVAFAGVVGVSVLMALKNRKTSGRTTKY